MAQIAVELSYLYANDYIVYPLENIVFSLQSISRPCARPTHHQWPSSRQRWYFL